MLLVGIGWSIANARGVPISSGVFLVSLVFDLRMKDHWSTPVCVDVTNRVRIHLLRSIVKRCLVTVMIARPCATNREVL